MFFYYDKTPVSSRSLLDTQVKEVDVFITHAKISHRQLPPSAARRSVETSDVAR